MKNISIEVENITLEATLNNSTSAQMLYAILPIKSTVNIWGDEIYFQIPLETTQEPDARQEVEIGTLAYWPQGHALCIFFGPIPLSKGDKPRAYSPVNVVGTVKQDATRLKSVTNGTEITVSANEN